MIEEVTKLSDDSGSFLRNHSTMINFNLQFPPFVSLYLLKIGTSLS